jgi:vitamin B12 transporter
VNFTAKFLEGGKKMKTFSKLIICILLLFIFQFSLFTLSFAEENTISMEEIIVTATKIDEEIEETTSTVLVITSEDIEKMNVQFIADVLRKIPELNLTQSGSTGKLATVLLRGGDSTHTLVMIDGIKVNSTLTGSFDFSGIPIEDIDRIEIVKGPQSTIYGSEAMAGVINIITKRGTGKPRGELSIEGGSYGTYNPVVTVSGGDENIDYRLTGNHFYTNGISAAKSGGEEDSYVHSSVSGKFGLRPSETIHLELTGKYSYDRTELDGFDFLQMEASDDLNFVQRGNHYLLSAKGKFYLSDIWDQLLTISTTQDSLEFRDPDTYFNNYQMTSSTDTIDWQNNLYFSHMLTVTGGIEYRREKGENVDTFDESLDNKALYLNNKLKLLNDDIVLNAGLRYDDHETFGNKTTYRIGAMYSIRPLNLRIRSSYGTGFRAPTLNELFFPFYGNRELKPEESFSWEISMEGNYLQKKVGISLTYFNQEYKNLIQTDPLTYTAANISKAEMKGIEATVSWQMTESLSLKSGYTYLDTEDKTTGKSLTRRPENKLLASLGFSKKEMSLLADYLYVDQRLDSSVNRALSSYQLVNLSGTYRVTKFLSLFGRIENLFDEDYEEVGGYNTPGFSVYGGFKVSI